MKGATGIGAMPILAVAVAAFLLYICIRSVVIAGSMIWEIGANLVRKALADARAPRREPGTEMNANGG